MRRNRSRDHAVVIGASAAGLLAAAALAGEFRQVTVVDRDALPDIARSRRGVPQGRHAHVLLGSGHRAIEDLLPGTMGGLQANGARFCRALAEIRFVVAGHELSREAVGAPVLLASRPLLESELRRRVRALPNVTIRELCSVERLLTASSVSGVVGAAVRGSGNDTAERVLADLVVAATGRSGALPGWLEELGCGRPVEDRFKVDLQYVSRRVRLDPSRLDGARLIGIGPRPGLPRGLMLIEQEDHWILTASGYGPAHHPPLDDPGFSEFVRSVAPPDVCTAVLHSEPLGPLIGHRFPANQRRRYEQMRSFPTGLLAVGDSVASFNPLYGQGISVAALEAVELRRCLHHEESGLARRFFTASAKIVGQAWGMAVGGDLALPEVDGPRPIDVRLTTAYVEQLLRVAEHDPVVAAAYNRVGDLLAPPETILQPAIAWRVLRGRRRTRRAAHPAERSAHASQRSSS